MQTAIRLEGIGEYYFSQKLRQIEGLNKEGKKIINLGIGSPDLPPHPSVIEVLEQKAVLPDTHAYQNYKGSPVLRQAIAAWYAKWYNVELDAESEILPLIGSKEGIMHICMTYLNPGDIVLVPNPGYPTYSSTVKLAGGEVLNYTLSAANSWEPDLEELSRKLADLESPVKLMFVNYPHMPTGKPASEELFNNLVNFAREQNILLIHDNPYSFILNDNPQSMLRVKGAKDVVIELNSLSKSHNMAGWRVGMLCGAKDHINDVIRFKSNMDSGMFLPVQLAAAKALELGREWHDALNIQYSERREKVFELLDLIACTYTRDQSGMFVWAERAKEFKDGFALSDDILYGAGVFITPGGIFGSGGDGYVRVSLCTSAIKIEEAINRIRNYRNLNGMIA